MASTLVLAAGGTGGHLFPAEALARELAARGRSVVMMTDRRARDYLGAIEGVETRIVAAGNPSAGGWAGRAGAAVRLATGTWEARQTLTAIRPGVVVGFGGYPSLPTVAAALALRVPVILHEQNAILGRVNRMFAGRAALLAASFGDAALDLLPDAVRDRTIVTGNPVRPAIAARAATPYAPPDADGPVRLLVFGGSQGARILSEAVPSALSALPKAFQQRLQVVQQCRPDDLARAEQVYVQAGIAADLRTFIDDMPDRIAAAHLVISRAGASTLSELTAIGRPAILAPYPHAMDDHQSANARVIAEAGAAWVMPDAEMTPAALAKRIQLLFGHPEQLAEAAAAAAKIGRPDAVKLLADAVEQLAPASSADYPGASRPITGQSFHFRGREAA